VDDVEQAAGMTSFADRLVSAQIQKRSVAILGVDPQLKGPNGPALPEGYDLRKFCFEIIDACAEHVVAIKAQLAFFEARGVDGMKDLRAVLSHAKNRGLLTIADGKRGDIDSVSAAYAEAYLGNTDFACDAITLNVYMGEDVINPFLEKVRQGKGLFICVKTSNKSSRDFQDLKTAKGPAWESLARMVSRLGKTFKGDFGISSIGAVVGATFPKEAKEARRLMPDALFLVPGYGVQGANASDAVASVRSDGRGVIVNASRSLMYAYQFSQGQAPGVAASAAARRMKNDLNDAVEKSRKVSKTVVSGVPKGRAA
jgi:orotidine-5'-phosphate decarboxylase